MSDEKKLPPMIEELANAIEKKGLKVQFGLVQQRHIQTIEDILDDLGSNDYAWSKIAKEIGWEKNAARDHYISYLRKKIKKDGQED